MKAELVPDNGDAPIPITRDLTIVGRREFADVVIEHPSLSKRHCLLVKTDGLLVIRDLITTNGTKVKGQRIRWAALLPDDRVALGDYKLRIYLGPDHVPSPSELFSQRRRSPAGPTVPRPAPAAEEFPDELAAVRGAAQFQNFAPPSSLDDLPAPAFEFAPEEEDDEDLIELG